MIITIGLLNLPHTKDFLKENPQIEYWTSLFFLFGTVYVYYFNIFNPYSVAKKLREKNLQFEMLNDAVSHFCKKYSRYDLSLNVVIPHRVFFHNIEPKKNDITKRRWRFFSSEFLLLWNKGHRADQSFRLSVNQGLCGIAYNSGVGTKVHSGLFNGKNSYTYIVEFNDVQIKQISDLVIVCSCAIPDNGNKKGTVGVLNVESREKISEQLLTTPRKFKNFTSEIIALSLTVSKIISKS